MEERAPARARVEAALVVAKDDVAQTGTWRFDGQGEVGGQVRRIRSWKSGVVTNHNTMEKRAARALKLIQVGELSAGRHALEGADLADGNTATLRELRQRLANPRDPIPPVPVDGPTFNLDERVFCRNVRVARKGAAGGPSGMTNDHVRESGGVRGIVSGEVKRSLTARTIAQQVGPAVKAATAPFPVASIDGISACNSISRRAMLLGLQRVEGGSSVIPFVDMFGWVHTIQQGEGGEQGDALMPLLFCVGQHAALQEVQARSRPTERLFAYLDDVHLKARPGWCNLHACVVPNMLVRNMDLAVPVAGDAPLWGGVQFAVDTRLRGDANPGEEQRHETEWHCQRQEGTSSGRTPNWLAPELGHVWWFQLWRLVVDGSAGHRLRVAARQSESSV